MAENDDDKRKRRNKTGKSLTIAGAAVGIGSAALVAALLYARPKIAKLPVRREAEAAD